MLVVGAGALAPWACGQAAPPKAAQSAPVAPASPLPDAAATRPAQGKPVASPTDASATRAAATRPAADVSYIEDPIRLTTDAGELAGTLLLPSLPSPVPVVLIIGDSGPTDRNGNAAGAPGRNDDLRLLAATLATQGIASVRYDKRGIGASRAALESEEALTFERLADDAAAWLALLGNDRRFSGVTAIGHGEGALLAALACERPGASAAVALVTLEPTAQRASALLREQLRPRMPAQLEPRSDEILTDLELGQSVADVPDRLMALYRPAIQPYLISWFRYDPLEVYGRSRLPLLVVQGSNDLQIEADAAERIRARRSDAKVVMITGMNHVLKTAPNSMEGQKAAYTDPSLPLAAGLAEAIIQFVYSVRPAH